LLFAYIDTENFTPAQLTPTRFKPLLKKEFAAQSIDTHIMDGLSNLAMKPGETIRELLTRVTKTVVIIKESYKTYWDKAEGPNNNLNGGIRNNVITTYINNHCANLMNFFKMNIFRAALPPEIRHVVGQQNQNELTLTQIYDRATLQQREGTEAKKIAAIEENNEPDQEESGLVKQPRQAEHIRGNQSNRNNRPGNSPNCNGKYFYCKLQGHRQDIISRKTNLFMMPKDEPFG
jgi:hypothetical protein